MYTELTTKEVVRHKTGSIMHRPLLAGPITKTSSEHLRIYNNTHMLKYTRTYSTNWVTDRTYTRTSIQGRRTSGTNSRTKITFAVKRVMDNGTSMRVTANSSDTRITSTDNRSNSKYVWSSCDDRGTSSTNSKTRGTYYRTDITFKRDNTRTYIDLTENTKDVTSHLRFIVSWNFFEVCTVQFYKLVKYVVTCTKLCTVPVHSRWKQVKTFECYNIDKFTKKTGFLRQRLN